MPRRGPPRLKFCRDCGGRVDDAPAEDARPPAAPDEPGDATMVAALPRKAGAAAPTRIPENAGDATVIGAFSVRSAEKEPATMAPDPEAEQATMAPGSEREPATVAPGLEREPATMAPDFEREPATMAPSADREPATMAPDPEAEQATMAPPADREPATMAPAESDLGKTMMTPPDPSPEAAPPAATGEETILGALPTVAPDRPPAPPVPVEEPEPDPEPITDNFDEEGDDSGPTLLQEAAPPPIPELVSPPPPPPSRAPAAAAAAVSALAAGSVRLEHWSPKVKASVVTLDKAETVVGRDRGDIQYPEDSLLSKKHARFFRDADGRLCVEDLGALNGTYLRLRAPVKLEHRDILFIGRHSFRFELLQHEEQDDRTIEGDPLTRVQGVQGKAPRARLVKRQSEGYRGLPFFFGTQRYVLGRTDGTHNFQKDDLMSRRHAALEYREGDYWLEDLGSQNGTFLRLRGPWPLESGDVVMMGDQYFKAP